MDTTKLTRIPINIWDDYYEENEDGTMPEGEKQETYIYVEDSDISHEIRKECLEKLLNGMQEKIKLDGVNMWMFYYDSKLKYPQLVGTENEWCLFERWEIRVEGLTHKRKDELIDELNNLNLSINNIPFEIYSES